MTGVDPNMEDVNEVKTIGLLTYIFDVVIRGTMSVTRIYMIGGFLLFIPINFAFAQTLEKQLQGVWLLTKYTCAGKLVDLGQTKYTLSFEGSSGTYTSQTSECTQLEPEEYAYVGKNILVIKQGIRKCIPDACSADLPSSECGKETNKKLPQFKVSFHDKSGMTLYTNDPASIDCSAPGQSKPAVFTFKKHRHP